MRAMLFACALLVITASPIASAHGADAPPLEFSLETVDSAGDAGRSPSIAVGSDGTPHVGYLSGRTLRYAHRTPDGWVTEPVTDVYSEYGCSLTLGADGRPLVSFVSAIARSALREDQGWRIEFLGGCNGPSHTALTSTADGTAHACILGSCSGGNYVGVVDYSTRVGGHWEQANVETRADNFALRGHCSIAAGDAGDPHIAVWNLFSTTLRYFHRVGNEWRSENIGNGTTSSIALDAAGVPHVAFYDPAAQALNLGVRRPEGWSIGLVDDAGDVGGTADLEIGADATLHVAYHDATRGHLKYARREAGATDWTMQVVDSTGDVGPGVSLDLDPDGAVHIAYFDATNGDLRYASSRRVVAVHPANWGTMKGRYRPAIR